MTQALHDKAPRTRPRGSGLAAWTLGLGVTVLALTQADTLWLGRNADNAEARIAAKALGITDLALFNEARYARHLSQADRFAAFQDQPMALERFPSGSFTVPGRP